MLCFYFVVLRLVYTMLLVSLDCPCLIAPSEFCYVYYISAINQIKVYHLYSVLDLIISYCDLVVTRNCHVCVLSLELLTISGSYEGYSSNA